MNLLLWVTWCGTSTEKHDFSALNDFFAFSVGIADSAGNLLRMDSELGLKTGMRE